ncbi:MAG: SAP domain-containing protein [Syntrophales bacterium]
MKMQEVVEIAKRWDIPYRIGVSKEKLIRAIQLKEGYQPCFRQKSVCDQNGCLWMTDCIASGR